MLYSRARQNFFIGKESDVFTFLTAVVCLVVGFVLGLDYSEEGWVTRRVRQGVRALKNLINR